MNKAKNDPTKKRSGTLSNREVGMLIAADKRNKSIADFKSDLYGAVVKDVRFMTATDYKPFRPLDDHSTQLPKAIVIELSTGVLITALVEDKIQNLGVMQFYNKSKKSSHEGWELVNYKGDLYGVL
jgi:hypothetical protein